MGRSPSNRSRTNCRRSAPAAPTPGMLDQIHVDYYGSPVPLSPGRATDAARRPHDRRPAVGKEDGPEGREGDPRVRSGPEPVHHRRPDPRADARADRRAPPRTDQGRQGPKAKTPRSPCATCAATPTSTARSCSRTRKSPRTTSAALHDDIQKLTDRTIAEIDKLVQTQGSRDPRGLTVEAHREPARDHLRDPDARPRRAASRGHRHGRQRPLGQEALHAAHLRPQAWRRRAGQHHQRLRQPRRRAPDRVRVLVRELEAARGRGLRPDGPGARAR